MNLPQKISGTVNLLAIVDAEGIVTKETKYGDTSRILTVITKELGKISVLASNVRKGKSGLLSATSLFSHSKLTLFKNSSSALYKLNEGELVTSFSALRESLEKMAFASYFCDIANFVVQEASPDIAQAELLLRSLYMLCKDDANYEKIKAVYEFRTLTLGGLMPDISLCGGCGTSADLKYFSPLSGGVYCEKCHNPHPDSAMINDSLLAALSYIIVAEDKKIFSFNMSDTSIKYLSQLGERSVEILLDKKFKTLDYLRKVTALS